ncbi:MAG: GNAT family N-acetyltransferase [Ruminococcaceae bacterium]|nr:GNAT family N-acetyltransferase [Oscillospiraceae bacterium]
MSITYQEERLTKEQYIEFLCRTNLGSQYPKERFEERIGKLVKNVPISLTARDGNLIVGVCFGITDFAYWLCITDLGVDRSYERRGIGTTLLHMAHEKAGGEKDIIMYLCVNENAVPFYEKNGLTFCTDVMGLNRVEWTSFNVGEDN